MTGIRQFQKAPAPARSPRLQPVRVGRRTLLVMAGGGVLAACSGDDSDAPADPPDAVVEGLEAPMLAEQVEAGTLPALEDRLPENPLVVEPFERLGVYGGTWNTAILGPADQIWLARTIGYEGLLRWDLEWTTPIPNLAESVDASADGREFTITLRRGIKWSDGTPFTTDDIMFVWEDIFLNEDLTPAVPIAFTAGGEPATFEQIDDQSVRVVFSAPAGLFLRQLARFDGATGFASLTTRPRHVLEQFHPTYNPDVAELAEQEGFADWLELFQARMEWAANAELPTLNAWMLTTGLGEGSQVVAERNPYYWKVDPEGRQLPYLDEVVFDVVADEQVMLLNASNGELDFHTRHFNSLTNKPVLAESRESGNFDFVTLQSSFMNEMVISLNLNHEDPVKREIFQNKDFRIGLSHAINRPEMNTVIFQDEGEAWQAAPLRESIYFDEELAKQYTEYNIDLANEHLDRAGYSERDGEGFRLGPDGNRISFAVEVASPGPVAFWVDAMELVVGYWSEVGIQAVVTPEDRSLFAQRTAANQHDASVWTGPGGRGDELFRVGYYFPSAVGVQAHATLWAKWYASGGANPEAEQPPEAPMQQMELYGQLLETPDEDERNDLFRQILDIAKDQFYVLGTIAVPEGYGIVSNDFHNVPPEMPDGTDYANPASTNPAQYFIE